MGAPLTSAIWRNRRCAVPRANDTRHASSRRAARPPRCPFRNPVGPLPSMLAIQRGIGIASSCGSSAGCQALSSPLRVRTLRGLDIWKPPRVPSISTLYAPPQLTNDVSLIATASFANSMTLTALSSTPRPVTELKIDVQRRGVPSSQRDRYIPCAPRSIIAPPPHATGRRNAPAASSAARRRAKCGCAAA